MDGYDDGSLINPYNLLGLTIKSTPQEVRRAYYNLALLCHPDKGGSPKDMDIINSAYKYVIEQIECIDFDVTVESLEEDFSNFCLEQENKKRPSLMEIHDEVTGFNTKFNEEFENHRDKVFGASLPGGYGELMEKTQNTNNYQENLENDNKNPLKNGFNKEVILYQQPNPANSNESFYDYKKDYSNIEDYSVYGTSSSFGMQDYGFAFSDPVKLPEVKETSPPMANESNTIKSIDVNKYCIDKNEFPIPPPSPKFEYNVFPEYNYYEDRNTYSTCSDLSSDEESDDDSFQFIPRESDEESNDDSEYEIDEEI